MNNKLPCGDYLIDLHIHADGALSPDTVLRLANMQGETLPTTKKGELSKILSVPPDCRSLNEYLRLFALPTSLMQTKETISEAFYLVKEDLRKSGIIYAELRFAPQLHTARGLTQEEVIDAALHGCSRSSLKTNLIVCCMRGYDNLKDNMETVYLAKRYEGRGVVAVDLAGAEALFPTADFGDLFAYAKSLGLKYTIHAGEASGPKSIEKALNFGASRIGHGIHSAEDDALMLRLAESGVPLELCITSNLQTEAAQNLESYPLKRLMDAGVTITLNTDNPIVSATSMRRELEIAMDAFSLSSEDIKGFLINSAKHSFADEDTKKHLRKEIEKAFTVI